MHGSKGCKKGVIDIKNIRLAIFKVDMCKKFFFYENDLDLTSFSQDLGLFPGYIFVRTLFPET